MKSICLKFALSLAIVAILAANLSAQQSDKSKTDSFIKRVSVGGSFGLQFGTGAIGVLVSPEVRLRAIDQLYFGLGFSYQYLKYRDYYYDLQSSEYLDLSLNVWGGRIFTRYYLSSLLSNEILGNLFAHLEYEYITYTLPYEPAPIGKGTIIDPYLYYYNRGNDIKEINSIFVGGGYKQPLGSHAFMDLLLLFNLNETYDSPYSNPIIRIGFGYGF